MIQLNRNILFFNQFLFYQGFFKYFCCLQIVDLFFTYCFQLKKLYSSNSFESLSEKKFQLYYVYSGFFNCSCILELYWEFLKSIDVQVGFSYFIIVVLRFLYFLLVLSFCLIYVFIFLQQYIKKNWFVCQLKINLFLFKKNFIYRKWK